MHTSQISPLNNHLRVLYDVERRLVASLEELCGLVGNRRVREALEARVRDLRGHLTQLEEAFGSLGAKPIRRNPDKRVEMLFRALDQQVRAHRKDPDFDDTVLHTLGRISQIQVRHYAQAVVMSLEAQLPLLSAGLQDMLDDYSEFTRRLSKDLLKKTGQSRGKGARQSEGIGRRRQAAV